MQPKAPAGKEGEIGRSTIVAMAWSHDLSDFPAPPAPVTRMRTRRVIRAHAQRYDGRHPCRGRWGAGSTKTSNLEINVNAMPPHPKTVMEYMPFLRDEGDWTARPW